MIKDKQSFNTSLARVLLEEGLSLDADGQVFIRSLEGDFWCVGYLNSEGKIDSETEFSGDLDGAISYFHKLIEESDLC